MAVLGILTRVAGRQLLQLRVEVAVQLALRMRVEYVFVRTAKPFRWRRRDVRALTGQ
jgi:hypothetical protein